MPTHVGPLNVAQTWLRKHSTSPHTKGSTRLNSSSSASGYFLASKTFCPWNPVTLRNISIKLLKALCNPARTGLLGPARQEQFNCQEAFYAPCFGS